MLDAAIVGLGNWGQRLVSSVQGKSGKIRFVAGVTRSVDKSAEFARQHDFPLTDDYAALLADRRVAAVVLATPHSMHAEHVKQAARAGKHVYVEKPFTLERASAEDAVGVSRECGIVLAVGFNRRFRPALLEVKQMAADGRLGQIVHLEGAMSGPPSGGPRPRGAWRATREESPGGAMTAKGIHIVDQMIWLCGPVDSVYALSDRRTGLYAPLDDTTSLALHFKSGVTGALSSIYATAEFWRLHAFGSKAWAQVTGESTLTVCEAGGKPYTREFADIDTARAALEGFADAVTAGEPYAVPPEDAIASSAVLEAMARSADAGAPVRIA